MLLELEKPKVDCCGAIFVANLRTFWRNAAVAYQNGQIRCVLVACEWLFKTGKIIQEHLNLERVRWGSAIAGPIKLAIFYFRLWWQGVQNWNHHSWTSQLGKDESRNRNRWHLIFDIHWYSSFLLSGKTKLNPHEHANNVTQKVALHFPAFTDNCLHSKIVVQSSKQFSFTDVQQLWFCFGIDSKCEKLLIRMS